MTARFVSRNAICGLFSVLAVMAAFANAKGTGFLIEIGFWLAIGTTFWFAIGMLILLVLIIETSFAKGFDSLLKDVWRKHWNIAVWIIRASIVALASLMWYSVTVPTSHSALITPMEAMCFYIATWFASACATRYCLAQLKKTDRTIIEPFALVLMWLVISTICCLILISK